MFRVGDKVKLSHHIVRGYRIGYSTHSNLPRILTFYRSEHTIVSVVRSTCSCCPDTIYFEYPAQVPDGIVRSTDGQWYARACDLTMATTKDGPCPGCNWKHCVKRGEVSASR